MAGVVSHNKDNVAVSTGVSANEMGKINSRGGVCRHLPRGRYCPVAAVNKPRRRRPSCRPVDFCGRGTDGEIVATLRAPIPP